VGLVVSADSQAPPSRWQELDAAGESYFADVSGHIILHVRTPFGFSQGTTAFVSPGADTVCRVRFNAPFRTVRIEAIAPTVSDAGPVDCRVSLGHLRGAYALPLNGPPIECDHDANDSEPLSVSLKLGVDRWATFRWPRLIDAQSNDLVTLRLPGGRPSELLLSTLRGTPLANLSFRARQTGGVLTWDLKTDATGRTNVLGGEGEWELEYEGIRQARLTLPAKGGATSPDGENVVHLERVSVIRVMRGESYFPSPRDEFVALGPALQAQGHPAMPDAGGSLMRWGRRVRLLDGAACVPWPPGTVVEAWVERDGQPVSPARQVRTDYDSLEVSGDSQPLVDLVIRPVLQGKEFLQGWFVLRRAGATPEVGPLADPGPGGGHVRVELVRPTGQVLFEGIAPGEYRLEWCPDPKAPEDVRVGTVLARPEAGEIRVVLR
jgi:hypothetical protein